MSIWEANIDKNNKLRKKINLVCPVCKNQLVNEKDSFQCYKHGVFKSCRGIPILMMSSHDVNAKYFGEHWNERKNLQYAKTKLTKASEFIQPIGQITEDTSILDAGCGDGIHASVLNKLYGESLSYWGIDISLAALLTAKERNDIGAFVNSDIEFLPFESEAFDITISYGVLAYTRSPKCSFDELCRVTKTGGLVGVWFYPKPVGLSWQLLKVVRYIVGVMPELVVNFLANFIVPFLVVLPTSSKVNLFNATWAQCKEIVLVNIAPKNLWYPEKSEILGFFKESNFDIVDLNDAHNITIWGIKK